MTGSDTTTPALGLVTRGTYTTVVTGGVKIAFKIFNYVRGKVHEQQQGPTSRAKGRHPPPTRADRRRLYHIMTEGLLSVILDVGGFSHDATFKHSL